jgi:hypothetical protein
MDFVFADQDDIMRYRLFGGVVSATFLTLGLQGAFALAGSSVDDRSGTDVDCDDATGPTTDCDASDAAGQQASFTMTAGFDF